MTPALRKLSLTAHITFSVGWLGAVAGFLVLSIGLTSQSAEVVRGVYLAMTRHLAPSLFRTARRLLNYLRRH